MLRLTDLTSWIQVKNPLGPFGGWLITPSVQARSKEWGVPRRAVIKKQRTGSSSIETKIVRPCTPAPRSTNTVIGRTHCGPVCGDRAISDSELRSSQRKPGTEAIDPARSERAVRTIRTSPVNSASVLLNQSLSQQSAFHVAYTVNAADRNGPTSYQCHHPTLTKSSINTKRYHTHPNQIQFKT